jgi:hypothetical protein
MSKDKKANKQIIYPLVCKTEDTKKKIMGLLWNIKNISDKRVNNDTTIIDALTMYWKFKKKIELKG